MGSSNEYQIEIGDDSNKYTMVTVPKYQRNCSHQNVVRGSFKMNTFGMMVALSIVLVSISTCQSAALPANPPASTAAPETSTDSSKYCHLSTPCGWAVYVPFTRRVDYFMKNTCVCPSDKTCIRTDDDLSVSAYVYRCGQKTATTEAIDVPVY